MVESEQILTPDSGLTWQTFGIAFAIHVAVFLTIWGIGWMIPREEEKKEEEIIPIDLTIVPPWAKKTDDPNPDHNPPPPKVKQQERPKSEAPKPKVKDDFPMQTGEAVEHVKDEPEKKTEKKPEKQPEKKKEIKPGELKNKAKLQTAPKPQKSEPKLKDSKNLKTLPPPPGPPPLNIPQTVKDFGKGTAAEPPRDDWKKLLDQGYRYGSRNQIASSEGQRCVSLIADAIRKEWDKESFSWHMGLRPIEMKLKLGAGGVVRGFSIKSGSGDESVDRTAQNALARLKGRSIPGLTSEFIKQYPELDLYMEPTQGR